MIGFDTSIIIAESVLIALRSLRQYCYSMEELFVAKSVHSL